MVREALPSIQHTIRTWKCIACGHPCKFARSRTCRDCASGRLSFCDDESDQLSIVEESGRLSVSDDF